MVATFLVRLLFPFGTGQFAQARLWQWPEYIALFALGITESRHAWLSAVPDLLRQPCSNAAVLRSSWPPPS